ncbi:hypothetical protein QR680_013242 [Steinernema hermaphroditum]|uniref:Ground-like domain-containing protein n=1 Tax=Steinernema hermaphroditum TaxID=289476 RepID=A0AA39I6E5_9BILA|nr:hypothetical protein QR680_013242 [Steinernema hermaphroditum]
MTPHPLLLLALLAAPFLQASANEGAKYECNSVMTPGGGASRGTIVMDAKNETNPGNVAMKERRKKARLDTDKCNNSALRKIMKKVHYLALKSAVLSVTTDPTESKRNIYRTALAELNVHLNVFCARCEFSYVSRTTMYCQMTGDVGDVTCYAFREN